MKKKVLFFLTSLSTGGTEKATVAYVNELAATGKYEIILCVMFYITSKNTLEYSIEKTVNIIYFSNDIIGNRLIEMLSGFSNGYWGKIKYAAYRLKYNILFSKKFDEVMDRYRPTTIIQGDSVMPDYFQKYSNITKIIFIHFSIDHIFSHFFKAYRIKNWLKKLQNYDQVIAVSRGVYEQMAELGLTKNLHLFYNPFFEKQIKLQADQAYTLPPGIKENDYIISVARLDENQKDFTSLINALALIKKKYAVAYNLVILGDGRDRESLEKLVLDLGLQQSVFFLGIKQNPYPYIANSSLFVLSTRFEGFGIVLLEALLLDKLVISSDCYTGPAEILNHEKLLVPVGDKEAMAEAIYNLLNDKRLQEQVLSHLQNQKKIFDPLRSIHGLENLLQ
ncbi:glycosyltransferase [Dyadobacter sp. CY356]|uniref:glycosyltransferase n=1 Tax=Dyadobacter sp. CY356 TaxID=2906442 RepID=UPI001F17E6A7|nr:glycosyltransferase [Dyadobacter sp. CY356]MCF0058315.1 glycosyltransferase [Dyadobacter sp. CY356]